MGKGVFSRRQRKLFQSFCLITVVCGMMYAFTISYDLHKQLKKTEAVATKHQQHQEALSSQLQVVYEHRSKLEKSLQKEKLDHKKAKEDFLAYKLESQQTLNKEKEDSSNRLSALQAQQQTLKSQHEELQQQYHELLEKHQSQGEDRERVLDEHSVEMEQLKRDKEAEISRLRESVYNLREENRQLRKAHQDIHTQLLDVQQQHSNLRASNNHLAGTLRDHKSALALAQLQVEELRQLKGALAQRPNVQQPVQNLPETHRRDQNPPAVHADTQNPPDPHTHIQTSTRATLDLRPNVPDQWDQHRRPEHLQMNHHQDEGRPARSDIRHASRHGLADKESNIVAQNGPKLARQIALPAQREEKKEKGMSKERGEREKRINPKLEHLLTDSEAPAAEEERRQSQTLRRQNSDTEEKLGSKALGVVNGRVVDVAPTASESDWHTHTKQDDGAEDWETLDQKRAPTAEEVTPERDPNNQGEDELEEAKEADEQKEERTEPRPAASESRPAMVRHRERPENNGQYGEEVEEEAMDELEEEEEKQMEEELEGEDDPYIEDNGEEGEWREDKLKRETETDDANAEDDYKEEEDGEEVEAARSIISNDKAEM